MKQAAFSLPDIHWPSDAADAIAVQKSLAQKVRIKNDFEDLKTVVGIDVSYDIQNDISHAIVVFMKLDRLEPVASIRALKPTIFPYIPGLLSFREIPVVLEALGQLTEKPDVLMVDGQGIAHPRRLGIAAHLGVLLDIPTLGVAKSRLCGSYKEPGPKKGDQSLLMDKGEKIGTVLRSKEKTNPLFISPGHRIDHETALQLVLQTLTRYRLPEPTRIADKLSKLRPEKENRLI